MAHRRAPKGQHRALMGDLEDRVPVAPTLALAARCAFSLDELCCEYPREIVPDGDTPTSWLRVLTDEGAPAAVRQTLAHELALIAVVVSYRSRSVLRDVGRALGMDLDRIAALSKSQQWFDGCRLGPERLREKTRPWTAAASSSETRTTSTRSAC